MRTRHLAVAWLALDVGVARAQGTEPTTQPEPPRPQPAPAAPLTREDIEKIVDERVQARMADEKQRADQAAKDEEKKKAEEAEKAGADFHPEKSALGYSDFSWMPGNYAPSESPLKWGPFTGEFRVDAAYHWDAQNPKDNTIGGSTEAFRHNELQITQLGFGGDFYYKGVMGRLMTQFGMYSQTTPRNDASPGKGQWNLDNAYRYVSEAYGGYHFNVLHGINLQAGIFMSYIGLWSYYNFDNWTYQPSYVSSNTPWFFNGVRVQIFPSEKLKIEPWFVNGWQSYGKFNEAPGGGLQLHWRPTPWFALTSNNYFGADTLGIPDRKRVHTDDSVMFRFFNDPESKGVSRVAASLTVDLGCEFGGAGQTTAGDMISNVSCSDQYFAGFMSYVRAWFYKNQFGATFGGGAITNPGRYLVLLPPINGATAFTGSPYFTMNQKDKFTAWDMQWTLDWMPREFITFRFEVNHRQADVPYFTGSGGVTPPGGNTGTPGTAVPGWAPDLTKYEDRLTWAMLVRY